MFVSYIINIKRIGCTLQPLIVAHSLYFDRSIRSNIASYRKKKPTVLCYYNVKLQLVYLQSDQHLCYSHLENIIAKLLYPKYLKL